MASKRQPSKQRRQSQNQKQRAALEARRQAAADGGATASTPTGGSSSAGSSSGGSVLSRFRGAPAAGRAARTKGAGQPPGHTAALSALLAAVAAAVVGSFLFKVPVDRSGEVITTRGALVAEWSLTAREAIADAPSGEPTAETLASIDDWLPGGEEPYLVAFWPVSAAVILPVIGTALGFRAVSRRSPAKIVNRTMYVTLFGALLASQLLIIFLPAVISLAVAAFQVRKAEVQAAQAAATDGDVIEVAEADDDAEPVDEPAGEVIDVDEVDEVDEPAERP
jgi:hypothetical protein